MSRGLRRSPPGDVRTRTSHVNQTVHWVLLVGLAISATLMIAGLAVVLAAGDHLPVHALKLTFAFRRAGGLHGDGLLMVGLLALILTPFLRVAGSIVVFAWERDWRYTLITLVVLAVMVGSLFLGSA